MADRATLTVRHATYGTKGSESIVLEDPGNDALVAAFTSVADGKKYGPAIEDAFREVERLNNVRRTMLAEMKKLRDESERLREDNKRLLKIEAWARTVAEVDELPSDYADCAELAEGWRNEAREVLGIGGKS